MAALLQECCDIRIVAICDDSGMRKILPKQVSGPAHFILAPGSEAVASQSMDKDNAAYL